MDKKDKPKDAISDVAFILLPLVLFIGGAYILSLKIAFWSLFLGIASIQIGIVLTIFSFEYFTKKRSKAITEDYKTIPCLICKRLNYVPKYQNTTICNNCQMRLAQGFKKMMIAVMAVFSLSCLTYLVRHNQNISEKAAPKLENNDKIKKMNITSTAFENNQSIPQKYSCEGENINPPLSISEIPEGTKSLVLIVDDPDAPAKVWVHWLLWNIDPSKNVIPEGNIPEGAVRGTNDSNHINWSGPCPPSGTHRYFFRVYALDNTLDLAEGARRSELEEAIKDHILSTSELVGLYSK